MKNIVFIDDEEDLTELFPILFAGREDLNIACFLTHDAALAHINDNEVDIILIDYRMKEGSAINLINKLPEGFEGETYIVTGELALVPDEEKRVKGVIKKPFKRESCEEIF